MFRRFSSLLGSFTVLTAMLFLGGTSAADGHGGGHGGGHSGGGGHGGGAYHGGAYHGGYYHGFYGPYHPYYGHGFYPNYGYGFYRPYYGYGLGALGVGALGFGAGLGLGLGLGGYGLGGGYGPYLPYGGGPSAVVVNTPGTPSGPAGAPPAETAPPPDNAVHLQLAVPENAEVLFDGEKTNQTGPLREFVSPQLTSGKVFNYTITVRYTGADGKPINDKRVIYVRANDWFRIDFTRPAPPERTPAPLPRPE